MRTLLTTTMLAVAIVCTSVRAAEPPAGAAPEQLRFKTPHEALDALREATAAMDLPRLRAIFGVEVGELGSGDPAQDQADLEEFGRKLATAAKLVPDGDDRVILQVGANAYEFPVPLVRKDATWFFDADAGKDELLNRRVGENELRALAVCRGVVAAQREYYAVDWDDDGVLEYAASLGSTAGKRDGLYWESTGGAPPSPLGPLVAEAQAAGHAPAASQPASQPAAARPYYGYYFKVLKQQGAQAAGGKMGYEINGHMVAGFALVAWPANWGNTGVMTFVVNTNGKVYEKNLGEKTAELAAAMTTYDPDGSWRVSED